MGLETPVLLLGFNRPELMSRVLDRVREVAPRQLFVAVDGPRSDRVEDRDLVQACRELVGQVDWPCEVSTLFQEENLGCGRGVSTAISWFFEHVPEGIILEDDIVPDVSFFGFCEELLDRYRDDERVFAVSGCNYVPPTALSDPAAPYRFSRIPHVWGWATWRRSWTHHRLDIADWRDRYPLRRLWHDVGASLPSFVFWLGNFELLARKEVDTWDVQLALAALSEGQLTATSNTNLVANIGFGESATHTVEDPGDLQPIGAMSRSLAVVPAAVDDRADRWTRVNHFRATWRGLAQQASRYVGLRRRRAL